MLILADNIDAKFRNLVENARSVRIYRDGHETGNRPTLGLASDRDESHLQYAKRAGLEVTLKSHQSADSSGYSRRDLLKFGAGALVLALARNSRAQDTDTITYDPGKGFYKYKRELQRGSGRSDLGAIHEITVWSDSASDWELINPHRQITIDEANDYFGRFWRYSGKPTDGMDYLRWLHTDTHSIITSPSLRPQTIRWTQLPIPIFIDEPHAQSNAVFHIRQALTLWDTGTLQFYKEVGFDPTVGESIGVRLIYGSFSRPGGWAACPDGISPQHGKVTLNGSLSEIYDIPFLTGAICHELGHVLLLVAHSPVSTHVMCPTFGPGAPQKPTDFERKTIEILYTLPNSTVLEYYSL